MQDLERLRALLEEVDRRRSQNRLALFYPEHDTSNFPARHKYHRHMEFFEAGNVAFSRLAMCANGVGKTEAMGGYEVVCHLTGIYPAWWPGARFNHPVDVWAAGDTGETVRDIQQTKLFGPPNQEGTGLIPADCIIKVTKRPNTNGAIDTALIRHVSGGMSTLGMKSYEQGVKNFFGTEKHIVWFDEIVPADIYSQGVARTRNRKGAMIITTFTPLKGRTEVVNMFLNEPDKSRKVIYCGWDDAPHLDDEWKRNALANTPVYLRDAVSKGVPTRGAGAIYPVSEKDFVINPIKVPDHWPRVFGFDGGYHNTAAVWLAWDKDTDTVYITDEYKAGEVDYAIHADAIKKRGTWIPGVGDAAAIGQLDGVKTLDAYRRAGVNLRLADKSVNAGITEVLNRLSTNRLKVFSTCQKWLDEFRTYSYDENQKIVKRDDHLMDATRYGIYSGLKIATNRVRERLIITEASFG